MNRYFIRRVIQAIPTLFGITLLSFMLMMATPGDPITLITFNPNSNPEATAILRRQLGLDQPAFVQYIYWLVGNDWVKIDVDGDGEGDINGTRLGVLRGDLGQSISFRRPVLSVIAERIPATLLLSVPAVIIGYIFGVLIGLFAAIYHNSWFDHIARVLTVLGSAIPSFWLGLIFIIIFSVNLRVLPMSGMRDITRPVDEISILDTLPYLIMPMSVFSLGIIAIVARYARTQVLEILAQDYVRTAYSKGLGYWYIFAKHVLPNALIPIITLLGGTIGFLLSGTVIIEQVFSWPGLGRLTIEAVSQRDYPLIMGTVLVSGGMYILGLLFSDLTYSLVDPRIKLQ